VENGVGLVGGCASEERFVEDLRMGGLEVEEKREERRAGGGCFE